ncbi:Ldh family oxidoreductase [Pseudorhodoferax sp.]|uniref:Ldh family oxidoreductase n=1 Tax=Pseudorhodoferax sp. TaxID=1993553 RepID=UPI002DD61FF8|nr:Ldh family oxidoreductase [Pseudorhodoferax sp.]
MDQATPRLPAAEALQAAQALLRAAGLDEEKAAAVARRLVEGDLLGHRSHGLQQLPTYLERLADGRIARTGSVRTLHDSGASFSWHTERLPGAWVLEQLIAEALARTSQHAVVTATLANCTHIGALQAYLEDIGRRGLLALLMVTDPGVASVAPPGGIDAVTTSNPMAACIPTGGDPILIDQSTTLVSNGAIAQHAAAGRLLPGEWVVDNQGRPSNDPAALNTEPPGTLMPLGGPAFGYKGFGFGLIVEAFALALSGFGRDQPRVRGAQGVFLQLLDPARFGNGQAAFLAATSALVAQCQASRPAEPGGAIRLPGQQALQRKAEQLAQGIAYPPSVLAALRGWAGRLGLPPLFAEPER